MKSQTTTSEALMRARIDRLVSGDLAEEERRELLEWLEADATRWRGCALAFLEAQVWDEALGDGVQGSGFRVQEGAHRRQETGVRSQGSGDIGQSSAWRRTAPWLMPLLAVAASIAAFACGMWWRGMSMAPERPGDSIVERGHEVPRHGNEVSSARGPLLASVPVKGGPLGNVPAVLQFPVLPPEAAKGEAPALSEKVRREWERRGYELKEERRYLPATLPDGRQVMVPVNEVKMKYVGRPVS